MNAAKRAITAPRVSTGVSAGPPSAVNVSVTSVRLDPIAMGFAQVAGSCLVLVMVSATTPQRGTASVPVFLGGGQLTAALSALGAPTISATAMVTAMPKGRALATIITFLVTGMGRCAMNATGHILVVAAYWSAQVVFRTTVAAVMVSAPRALISVCVTPIKTRDIGLGICVTAASLVTGVTCAQASVLVVPVIHALVVALAFKAQQVTERACVWPTIVLGTTRVRCARYALTGSTALCA